MVGGTLDSVAKKKATRSYWYDWYVKVQSALKCFHTRRNLEKGALPCSTGAGVLIAWSQVAESHLVKAIFVLSWARHVQENKGPWNFTCPLLLILSELLRRPAKGRGVSARRHADRQPNGNRPALNLFKSGCFWVFMFFLARSIWTWYVWKDQKRSWHHGCYVCLQSLPLVRPELFGCTAPGWGGAWAKAATAQMGSNLCRQAMENCHSQTVHAMRFPMYVVKVEVRVLQNLLWSSFNISRISVGHQLKDL